MAAGSVVSSSTYRDQTRVYGSRVTVGFAYTKERPKARGKPRETKVSHVRSLALDRIAILNDSPVKSSRVRSSRYSSVFIKFAVRIAFFSFISNARVSPPIVQRRSTAKRRQEVTVKAIGAHERLN